MTKKYVIVEIDCCAECPYSENWNDKWGYIKCTLKDNTTRDMNIPDWCPLPNSGTETNK